MTKVIVVIVLHEMKSTKLETRDSPGMAKKVVSGALKMLTVSAAIFSWVKVLLENIDF